MLVIRPVTLADLSALEQLAEHAVPRLTNLPANRERLEERIVRSQEAFESEIEYPGNEHYMFVLADDSRNEVLGTATIRAQAGAAEAYYTYRQETLIHASQQLNVRREVQTLALSHEASDATLLCALSLNPRYKGTSAESLLRRARLMFIAQYPERFSRILAVAFPGYLDSQNESPFWESVGRHFFARSFQEMNHIAGVRSKSFIAEVMPQFPLYLPLLTPQARAAIGREHPAHEFDEDDPDLAALDVGIIAQRAVDHFAQFAGGLDPGKSGADDQRIDIGSRHRSAPTPSRTLGGAPRKPWLAPLRRYPCAPWPSRIRGCGPHSCDSRSARRRL